MADPQTLPLILRNSTVVGAVPPKAEFNLNTLVVNRADGKLYWLDADGSTVRALDMTLASVAKLLSPSFTGNPQAPTPAAGDASPSLATTQFLKNAAVRTDIAQSISRAAMAVARNNIGAAPYLASQIGAATTLDASYLNRTIWLSGDAYNITMPASGVAISGDSLEFVNYAGGTITLVCQANTGFYYNGVYFVGTIKIGPGQSAYLTTDGSAWIVGNRALPPERSLNPDAANNFTDAQRQQLLANLDIALPYCGGRLTWDATYQLGLRSRTGTKILINGIYRTIPVGGVTVSNGGLAANTIYYVYAYWTGTAIALICSTNPPVTDPTYGLKTPSGTPSYTLVGRVVTNANSQFQDDPGYRGVLTTYNKRMRALRGAGNTYSTSSQSQVELSTAARAYFIADDETTALLEQISGSGGAGATSPGYSIYAYPSLDGSNASPSALAGQPSYGNSSIAAGFVEEPSEAWHYVTIKGVVQGAYTASVTGAVSGLVWM